VGGGGGSLSGTGRPGGVVPTGPPRLAHGDLGLMAISGFTLALRFQKRKVLDMKQRIEGVTPPSPPTTRPRPAPLDAPGVTSEPLMLFKVLERHPRTRVPYAALGSASSSTAAWVPPTASSSSPVSAPAPAAPTSGASTWGVRPRPLNSPSGSHFDRDRHLRRPGWSPRQSAPAPSRRQTPLRRNQLSEPVWSRPREHLGEPEASEFSCWPGGTAPSPYVANGVGIEPEPGPFAPARE